MKRLFIAEPATAPPEERISAGLHKTGSDGVTFGGRLFRPACRPGWLWCDRCGVAMAAEQVKQHRCEP